MSLLTLGSFFGLAAGWLQALQDCEAQPNRSCCSVTKSCPTLYDPRAAAHKASLSMGFSRQEYWNELPFPSPGDVPKPGVKCVSCFSSSVQSLSHVRLFATPWTETHQASLAITNSQSISRWILYHWATKEAFCHKLILELQRASSFKNRIWDFLAGPVVNTSPSNAEGRGAKIPYALWPRNQDINNISNIVQIQ